MGNRLVSGLALITCLGCQNPEKFEELVSDAKPWVDEGVISYQGEKVEKIRFYREKEKTTHWKIETCDEGYDIISKKILAGYNLNHYRELMKNHELMSYDLYIYRRGTVGIQKLPIEDLTGLEIGFTKKAVVWHSQKLVEDENGKSSLKSIINSYHFDTGDLMKEEVSPVFSDILREKLVQNKLDKLNGIVREEGVRKRNTLRYGPFFH
jgi:hypothetical protein